MTDDNLARIATGDGDAAASGTTRGGDASSGLGASGLGAVRDISVTMSMEVGRVRLTIDELLKLGEGSVVELERFADEPLDVLVNDTLVARGEAVVVGDRFGIRLTEVVAGGHLAGGQARASRPSGDEGESE